MKKSINPLVVRFDSIESTNTEAVARAGQGAPEGLCIVATEQTAGRGREQRTWYSPPGAGLYMSILFRPAQPTIHWPLMTMLAAVAVHDSLEDGFALDCDIKWPNDIHCGGRKISGILAEMCDGGVGQAVVVGIGINLLAVEYSGELIDRATSIQKETGRVVSTDDVFPKLLKVLFELYEKFEDSAGFEWLLSEWSRRSSYGYGKSVRVTLLSESFEGVTRGLETDGALRVETVDGNRIVRSGDVVALRSKNTPDALSKDLN